MCWMFLVTYAAYKYSFHPKLSVLDRFNAVARAKLRNFYQLWGDFRMNPHGLVTSQFY